jgi:hypothetical protein
LRKTGVNESRELLDAPFLLPQRVLPAFGATLGKYAKNATTTPLTIDLVENFQKIRITSDHIFMLPLVLVERCTGNLIRSWGK